MKLTINQARVMAVLERLAEEGAPCPTNAALADRIGSDTKDAAVVLAQLRAVGAIEILTVGRKRQVRIVATGAQTSPIVTSARSDA